MSRTVRGSKGAGYDYWSKRANGHATYQTIGREGKKRTHRIERATARQTLHKLTTDIDQ